MYVLLSALYAGLVRAPPAAVHAATAGNTTAAQPALQIVGIPFLHDSLGSLQHSFEVFLPTVSKSFCVEHSDVLPNGAGAGAGAAAGAETG